VTGWTYEYLSTFGCVFICAEKQPHRYGSFHAPSGHSIHSKDAQSARCEKQGQDVDSYCILGYLSGLAGCALKYMQDNIKRPIANHMLCFRRRSIDLQ
jgi:hypothetical protein